MAVVICPLCGHRNPDSEERCTACGMVLHPRQSVGEPEKKRSKIRLRELVTVAVLLICLVVSIEKIYENQLETARIKVYNQYVESFLKTRNLISTSAYKSSEFYYKTQKIWDVYCKG